MCSQHFAGGCFVGRGGWVGEGLARRGPCLRKHDHRVCACPSTTEPLPPSPLPCAPLPSRPFPAPLHVLFSPTSLPRPDAANAALQDSAQQQQQAAAPLTSALSGVLGALQAGAAAVNSIAGASGMTPGGSGGSGGDDGSFRSPPLVLGYVGDRPKSFPLQLRHSGRWGGTS